MLVLLYGRFHYTNLIYYLCRGAVSSGGVLAEGNSVCTFPSSKNITNLDIFKWQIEGLL
jgi:hypothetical protein